MKACSDPQVHFEVLSPVLSLNRIRNEQDEQESCMLEQYWFRCALDDLVSFLPKAGLIKLLSLLNRVNHYQSRRIT